MTRRGRAEALLDRYGETVAFGGAQFRALIRPLGFQSGRGRDTPEAYRDGVRYLYTGPAAHKLSTGGTVETAGGSYAVKRCDTVLLGGEELYVRAVLEALSPEADTEVRLERGGAVVARAESYAAKAAQGADEVIPWGESGPEEIAEGAVRWELSLVGVRPEAGADLFAPGVFQVVIARPGETVTYSGCRWKTVRNAGGPSLERSCTLEALAAGRAVEREANADG